MSASGAILEFRNVSLEPGSPNQTAILDCSLAVGAGGLGLILVDTATGMIPLCDAAEGLVAPVRGNVLFQGQDWQTMKRGEAESARSKIGRVFDEAGWISNLDVAENVTLRERHHTPRPAAEIRAEADRLARSFGLDGLPAGRPAWVPRDELRRAEWVRAFLGGPILLLLELATAGVSRDRIPALVRAVSEFRQRGGAVLWTTADPAVWKREDLTDAERFTVQGAVVRRIQGDAI